MIITNLRPGLKEQAWGKKLCQCIIEEKLLQYIAESCLYAVIGELKQVVSREQQV